jgi:glycosyltransferase involved in cell wall biosynthesis
MKRGLLRARVSSRRNKDGETRCLRVAFISHDSDLTGGATRSLLNLVDGLREHGIAPVVFCPYAGELTTALEEMGVPCRLAPFKPWLMTHDWRSRVRAVAKLGYNLLMLPAFLWKLRGCDVDLIYSNTSATPVGAFAALALGKPHIWHIRESLWLGLEKKSILGDRLFKYLLERADAVIPISEFVRRTMLSDVSTKTYVIGNGVLRDNTVRHMLETAPPFIAEDKYVFAYLGHIRPSKAQDVAIRALALIKDKHPHAVLLIAGEGLEDFIDELKKLCMDLDLTEQVRFLGYLQDPFPVYDESDAVIISSIHDALPRVVTEAMAMGKPVIGLRSGGIPEIIDDGITGILYEGGIEELAGCMERFLENPTWAHELGLNGLMRAREEYTVEVCAKRVADVLYGLMERRSQVIFPSRSEDKGDGAS